MGLCLIFIGISSVGVDIMCRKCCIDKNKNVRKGPKARAIGFTIGHKCNYSSCKRGVALSIG